MLADVLSYFYIRNCNISRSVLRPTRILQLRAPRIYLNPLSIHGSEQFRKISIVQLRSKLAELFLRETSIGTLENHAPSIFENIEHAQLEIMMILCPNAKK